MDRYQNFEELARNEREGRDYLILHREADSAVAIMAPHGGGIEPGTMDIADALAGSEFSFYAFKSIKGAGNRQLHLTSNRFDEPLGLRIARGAAVVVTVHGNREEDEAVFIGGRDESLKERIWEALRAKGYPAEISDIPGIRGISHENLCNRGTNGAGVQLEISLGLRKKLFENLDGRSIRPRKEFFYSFVDAIRMALLSAAL